MRHFERARATVSDAWRRLRGGESTPGRVAASVALGLFVGCVPIYGLHGPVCFAVSVPLKLNFPLAWAMTMISNPLTFPVLTFLEIELGSWVVRGAWVSLDPSHLSASSVGGFFRYALVGGLAIGAIVSVLAGAAVRFWAARAYSRTRTPST
jgi:uncharacterized protein (DUF2062 family)